MDHETPGALVSELQHAVRYWRGVTAVGSGCHRGAEPGYSLTDHLAVTLSERIEANRIGSLPATEILLDAR